MMNNKALRRPLTASKLMAVLLQLQLMCHLVSGEGFCSLGWPVVLGPASRDGSTQITIWAQAPNKNYYLIGGSSNS